MSCLTNISLITSTNLPLNMKPPWSLLHSAWSLGWLSPFLGWIKVTYLHWGCLSFFSALAQTKPYIYELNQNLSLLAKRTRVEWKTVHFRLFNLINYLSHTLEEPPQRKNDKVFNPQLQHKKAVKQKQNSSSFCYLLQISLQIQELQEPSVL